MKLGAIASPKDERDLKFAAYRIPGTTLPSHPARFGYDNIYPVDGWGMLGNDSWGDCVFAGACHEHMLWNRAAGHDVTFTTQNALEAYSAVTGFDPHAGPPGANPTDRGTVIRSALRYRQQTGISDSTGKRHKIGAYVALDYTNFAEVYEALFVCEAVALGIEVPESAMDEFNERKMWSYVPGSPIEGGHYVPMNAVKKHMEIITWARVVPMGLRFWKHYVTEAWGIISEDSLNGEGVSAHGFSYEQLAADLQALRSA